MLDINASPITLKTIIDEDGSFTFKITPSMAFSPLSLKHSVGEYVRGMAHTNGLESFWAPLKRAHKGTFHKMSPKHLNRYVSEFSSRHNVRGRDTIDQMIGVVKGMERKRLRYIDLISDNGLTSGARYA